MINFVGLSRSISQQFDTQNTLILKKNDLL